jgi:hypothetical protein
VLTVAITTSASSISTMEAAMNFEDLTPELQEKAKACKSPEELLALAKREGIELSDEQLEGIAGGQDWCGPYGCTKVKLT